MKKTRRFVALLLAAVLALALFTACGAAEQPQSAIGKVYEDWFVEQINSKRPGKPVQKVDVKHSEMRTALAKISEDAMTALSLVFPIQNLVNAVTIGFAIGINAVIAYFLGAKQEHKANEAATQGIVCTVSC